MTQKFQDGVTLARGESGLSTRAYTQKRRQVRPGEFIQQWTTTFQSGLTVTKFVQIRGYEKCLALL
jgi:hypothetical protein